MIPEWENCTGIPDLFDKLDDYLGFIYLMELEDGRYYIGRKQFWTKSGQYWRDSGWRDYTSSSNAVNECINESSSGLVSRRIIAAFRTKSAMRYAEASGIIRSGSYLSRDKGLNWSFDNCKGTIKLEDTDESQMKHLEEYFNEDFVNSRHAG